MKLKCPICGKEMQSLSKASLRKEGDDVSYFPFCSERCKLIDLGAWLDSDYSISTVQEPEDSEDENS